MTRRSSWIGTLALLPLLLGASGPTNVSGTAASNTPKVSAPGASGNFIRTVALRDLRSGEALRFAGNSADRKFEIGVSPDKLVQNAWIRVEYRFHHSLFLGHEPNLAVDWNGIALGTLPQPTVKEATPNLSVTFAIPSYLVNTRNTLRFRVLKDAKNPCVNFGLGSFVTIRETTSVTFFGQKIVVPGRLSDLPFPFLYPSMAGPRTIPFVFGSTDPLVLEAAGIVASSFGAQENDLPFRFPVSVSRPLSTSIFPTGNLILLAEAEDLPPGLAPAPIDGPFLALIPNPADPYGRILLVSGRSPAEIRASALEVALRTPADNASWTKVTRVDIPPPREPNDAPSWLSVDHPIQFGTLASPGERTVHGTGIVRIGFSIPPDLFSWHRHWVPLHLHFRARTLNQENRSRLDIFLNHQYQESLPLAPTAEGGSERTLDIPIAVRDLTPFRNQLEFNFNFRNSLPSIFSCTMNTSPELFGTVLPDSAIDLRKFPRFSKLPDLRLVPNGGYPFTRFADLSRTAVILSDAPGPGDIEVFLHMMATFGSQTGYPALRVTVVNPGGLDQVRNKDLILIGTYDSNPLLLRFTQSLPWESEENFQRLKTQNLLLELFRWDNPTPAHFGPSDLVAYFRNARMPLGVVMETASPYADNHLILSVVGVSQDGIRAMDSVVFDPRQFPGIFGNATVVSPDGLTSFFLPGHAYKIGHLSPLTSLRFWFYSHPLGIVLLILALAILAGWGVQASFRKYSEQARGVREENPPQ
jgi:hypothetical protein